VERTVAVERIVGASAARRQRDHRSAMPNPLYRAPGPCENQPAGDARQPQPGGDPMDKKAKTPKKPKQTKSKDGSAKAK